MLNNLCILDRVLKHHNFFSRHSQTKAMTNSQIHIAIFSLALLILPSFVSAHGCLTKINSKNGARVACAFSAGDPECEDDSNWNDAKSRSGIVRGSQGGSGEEKELGEEKSYDCDWCVLEKKEKVEEIQDGDWWTKTPGAHWDEESMWPAYPCMSRDSWGDRGSIMLQTGSDLEARVYINADHSGIYQYQLGCKEEPDNSDFFALTQWKAIHRTGEGVTLGASRDVGSTREETDAYFVQINCAGSDCGSAYMNKDSCPPDGDSEDDCSRNHCSNNEDDCFLEDSFALPSQFRCRGHAVLRWIWNSAETNEVFVNCFDVDLKVRGGGGRIKNFSPSGSVVVEGEATPAPNGGAESPRVNFLLAVMVSSFVFLRV